MERWTLEVLYVDWIDLDILELHVYWNGVAFGQGEGVAI